MKEPDKSTYADKLTLAEIGANDVEMVKDAIKNAHKYRFGEDKRKAMEFVKTAMDAVMKHLGININPPSSPQAIKLYTQALELAMEAKQIKIEHRNQYRGSENWRCGVYIYQRDELVTFISDIFTERRTEIDPISMKITKEDCGFIVITNARMDDEKRIFLLH